MPSSSSSGLRSISSLSMYEPGSPSSALTTITLSGSAARAANSHFMPAGKPAPPRPRTFASLTWSSSCSGASDSSAWRSPSNVPRSQQHRLVEHALALGLVAWRSAPASARSTTPSPASTTSPSRTAPARWQKPRQTVWPSETDPSSERSPRATPSPCSTAATWAPKSDAQQAVPVQTADVPLAARLDEVVVEGRDAVDRRLRQPRQRGRVAAVLVGDLAALVHRLLEDDRAPSGGPRSSCERRMSVRLRDIRTGRPSSPRRRCRR